VGRNAADLRLAEGRGARGPGAGAEDWAGGAAAGGCGGEEHELTHVPGSEPVGDMHDQAVEGVSCSGVEMTDDVCADIC